MPDAVSPPRRLPVRRVLSPLADFLRTETAGGIVLLLAAVAALVWANLPGGAGYEDVWRTRLSIGPLEHDLRHWINEGLMTVFFLVAGLEIKRELVAGELSTRRAAALPVVAAVGGMIVPALIYALFNAGTANARGWGVPIATDIAFAVGAVSALGRRVPPGVPLFLLALAIADDVGAIVVIAIAYRGEMSLVALASAVAAFAVYRMLQRGGRRPLGLMWLVGAAGWLALSESGIHATLAGVALGLLTRIPDGQVDDHGVSTADPEHALHTVSSLVVVPLFAVANAGIPISPDRLGEAMTSRVGLGIVLGLVVGKTLGVFAGAVIAVRLGIAALPAQVGLRHVLGAAALAGVGFTVALFIADLAFADEPTAQTARAAIIIGSLAAAVLGSLLLARRTPSSAG